MGSSQTKARTHVPCIGRQILNHCTTREVPLLYFQRATLFTMPSLWTQTHTHTRNNAPQPRAQLFSVLCVSVSQWLSAGEAASPHLALKGTHSTGHQPQKKIQNKTGQRPPSSQHNWKARALCPWGQVTLVTRFFSQEQQRKDTLFLDASFPGTSPSCVTGPPGKIQCSQRHKDTLKSSREDYTWGALLNARLLYLCSEGISAFFHHQLKLNSCSEITFQYGQLLLLEILKW